MRSIGSRLELFVDDWLIETLQGATLRLHHPQWQGVVLGFDAPWEGPESHYVTVLEYEGKFRAYYRGSGSYDAPVPTQVTAVATSDDGVTWERPSLGLFERKGSWANNIIWMEEGVHNFAPFIDANPAAKPSERFKAVGGAKWRGKHVLVPFVSEDGYRWRRWRQEPIITDGAFDSQNLAYWDAFRGYYVAFYRDFRDAGGKVQRYGGVRSIKFATSPDFLKWTPGQWLDFGDAPLEHLYTNATISYFRASHIYLAFPKRFLPERTAVPEHGHPGLSDGVFMSSRDGLHWDRRFMEAFLRPGRERESWSERSMGVAWGILQTRADELSVYWVEHFRHPTCRLRRGTLRLDGFASVNADYAGGELLTQPLLFEGRELVLNYATSAAGSVQVELQDDKGHPLPGYTLEDSPEMYGDEIEQVISWRNGSGVAELAGQPVRLRLVLRDADIYSLRFRA